MPRSASGATRSSAVTCRKLTAGGAADRAAGTCLQPPEVALALRKDLLRCAGFRRSGCRRRLQRLLLCEVAAVPQIPIEDAGQLSRLRAKRRPSTLQEEHCHDPSVLRVRIGGEPA